MGLTRVPRGFLSGSSKAVGIELGSCETLTKQSQGIARHPLQNPLCISNEA